MASYKAWYCDEAGNTIRELRYLSTIEYTKVVGDVGLCQIVIPHRTSEIYETPRRDRRLHIYRNQRLDFCWVHCST